MKPGASGTGTPRQAVGPLRRVVGADDRLIKGSGGHLLDQGTNALLMLRRVTFFDPRTGKIDEAGTQALLRWAADRNLGQQAELVRQAAARRERALAALKARGLSVIRLYARPEWRLIVGAGNSDNPHEIGISLHGTYGWPIIPGSSLKGLTAAWAERRHRAGDADAGPERLDRIFGTPRPGGRAKSPGEGTTAARSARRREATRGSVCFLDALPAGAPVRVTVDVVTPHVQPYYSGKDPKAPPAEYHNPVPSEFLVVNGGAFAVDLAGPEDDVELAAAWCEQAFHELGAGAKTSAGYGYLTVEQRT